MRNCPVSFQTPGGRSWFLVLTPALFNGPNYALKKFIPEKPCPCCKQTFLCPEFLHYGRIIKRERRQKGLFSEMEPSRITHLYLFEGGFCRKCEIIANPDLNPGIVPMHFDSAGRTRMRIAKLTDVFGAPVRLWDSSRHKWRAVRFFGLRRMKRQENIFRLQSRIDRAGEAELERRENRKVVDFPKRGGNAG